MKTTGRHGDNLDVAPPEDEVYTETVRETWEGKGGWKLKNGHILHKRRLREGG